MEGQVSQWYRDKSILITGSTGFMGKVLVEKLLRSCPDVKAIYLLMRSKKGRNPSQRLEDVINSPLFDGIRDSKTGSELFGKLKCVVGDVTHENVGLSATDEEVLRGEINVIFHMAANVRFDQPLKSEVMQNTGGTLRVLELAKSFSKLSAFIHVSTTYCHCDRSKLDETLYPAPHNPRKVLEMVQWMDEDILTKMEPHLLQNAPNTYAYSKCLTEQLVSEYADKFPIAIARPSIVVAVWKEPIPGFVDNLNGATGLIVGAGKGVIRTMYGNPNFYADTVPVDVAINSIILIAYTLGNKSKTKEAQVYNLTVPRDHSTTWCEAVELGRKHVLNYPYSIMLWYPGGSMKRNYWLHMIAVALFHFLPAYFIDMLLSLTRNKPFLVRTQKRIMGGLEVLQYYTSRPWDFSNGKIDKLSANLGDKDKADFYTDLTKIDWNEYMLHYTLGVRKYCLHEEQSTLPRARKNLKRLYVLDQVKNVLLGCLLLWLLFKMTTIIFSPIDSMLSFKSH